MEKTSCMYTYIDYYLYKVRIKQKRKIKQQTKCVSWSSESGSEKSTN